MAPPLALGEVPEEVRMNKLLGMNAPPAAKVYNEKERYHVEWKDLHMSQEEQDRKFRLATANEDETKRNGLLSRIKDLENQQNMATLLG